MKKKSTCSYGYQKLPEADHERLLLWPRENTLTLVWLVFMLQKDANTTPH